MVIAEQPTTAWPRVPISTAYAGLYDGPHATPKPSDDGPVFLGIGNITEDGHLDLSNIRHIAEEDFAKWTRRVEPRPGDIVFVYEAALNRYAIIPEGFRGCLGRRLALIRPDESKALGRFLFYYFFSEDWHRTIAKNTLSGATVDRIPLTTFPKFELNLPDLDVQRKVVAILAAYDDLIENNTRRIAILEEMARSLYREWFVEFRFPGHEGIEMVESEVGRLPRGWEADTLGSHVAVDKGLSYKGANLNDDGPFGMVSLKCFDGVGRLRREGIKGYNGDFKPQHSVQPGDIVLANTDLTQAGNIIGSPAVVPTIAGSAELLISHHLYAVRLLPKASIAKWFLFGLLGTPAYKGFAKGRANGTTVLGMPRDAVLDFGFARPPSDLLQSYEELVGPCYELAEHLERKNIVLRRTRDLLLPRLISGELDVSELDINTGELSA